MTACRSVPNQSGPTMKRLTPYALSIATAQFVTKATSNWVGPMPTPISATTCAGNAAAMHSHQCRRGTSSRAQKRMVLGGQNGAKMRSESVPT